MPIWTGVIPDQPLPSRAKTIWLMIRIASAASIFKTQCDARSSWSCDSEARPEHDICCSGSLNIALCGVEVSLGKNDVRWYALETPPSDTHHLRHNRISIGKAPPSRPFYRQNQSRLYRIRMLPTPVVPRHIDLSSP